MNSTPDAPSGASTSDASKRKAAIASILGNVFGEQDVLVTSKEKVTWHQNPVDELDPDLCSRILWEIYEYGFPIELQRLDEALTTPKDIPRTAAKRHDHLFRLEILGKVFPPECTLIPEDPPTASTGLAAPEVVHRISALEGLRQVVRRWPSVPPILHTTEFTPTMLPSDALMLEHTLASFYVEAFFRHAGRPPLIPHLNPF